MGEWGERGNGYFEMVAFVLVGDEVGAGEGDVVGERGRVAVDVVSVAEHLGLEIAAAFFKRLHCRRAARSITSANFLVFFLSSMKGIGEEESAHCLSGWSAFGPLFWFFSLGPMPALVGAGNIRFLFSRTFSSRSLPASRK